MSLVVLSGGVFAASVLVRIDLAVAVVVGGRVGDVLEEADGFGRIDAELVRDRVQASSSGESLCRGPAGRG